MKDGSHKFFWTETDANRRAIDYFLDNVSGFTTESWNFTAHPMIDTRKLSNVDDVQQYNIRAVFGPVYPIIRGNEQSSNIGMLVDLLNIR